jgi:ketosteroid isomerase-like protein
MKRHPFSLALLLFLLSSATTVAEAEKSAKDKDKEAVHNELRAFKAKLIDAVKSGDVDKQLDCVTDDVVTTWQNGKVFRGKANLKELMKNKGIEQSFFRGYSQEPEPTELTILYNGDMTGISYGTSVARYSIVGAEIELKNHWSATVVKESDGNWRIAQYHVSADIQDNPLLSAAKASIYWVGGIALVVGLLAGVVVTKLMSKPKAAA